LIEPECTYGYTSAQISEILGDRQGEFGHWMRGQTMAICDAAPERKWIDDEDAVGGLRLVDVGPPPCKRPHGVVVYPWDVERFIAGRPIVD
jgi:hypothetical protein